MDWNSNAFHDFMTHAEDFKAFEQQQGSTNNPASYYRE